MKHRASNAWAPHAWAFVPLAVLMIVFGVSLADAQGRPGQPNDPGAHVPAPDGPPPLPPEEGPPPLPSFYVAIGGQPVGPLALPEIAERIRRGEITPRTLVWRSGMADWAPASDVPLIAELFDRAGGGAGDGDGAGPRVEPAPEPDTPAFDPVRFVAGTWRNQSPLVFDDIGQTQGTVSLIYGPDGALGGGGQLVAAIPGHGPVQLQLQLSGSWTAAPVSDTQFTLETRSRVRISAPSLGFDETEESTETGLITVIDANTIRDSDGVIWVR